MIRSLIIILAVLFIGCNNESKRDSDLLHRATLKKATYEGCEYIVYEKSYAVSMLHSPTCPNHRATIGWYGGVDSTNKISLGGTGEAKTSTLGGAILYVDTVGVLIQN